MLEHWTRAGFAPDAFWEQTFATYNAAMAGAAWLHEQRWKIGLFTAYHSGRFAQSDFRQMPSFEALTEPRKPKSNREIAARFAAMAAASSQPGS